MNERPKSPHIWVMKKFCSYVIASCMSNKLYHVQETTSYTRKVKSNSESRLSCSHLKSISNCEASQLPISHSILITELYILCNWKNRIPSENTGQLRNYHCDCASKSIERHETSKAPHELISYTMLGCNARSLIEDNSQIAINNLLENFEQPRLWEKWMRRKPTWQKGPFSSISLELLRNFLVHEVVQAYVVIRCFISLRHISVTQQ